MYYIPSDLLDTDYSYFYNGNYYIIKTDLNCINGLCDCYSVFPNNDYIKSQVYSCSYNESKYSLDYSKLTSDMFYRKDLSHILIIFLIISIFIVYYPIKIVSRLLGRWLKV